MKTENTNRRIVIQGYPGAFHEIAARYFYGNEAIDIVPAKTFRELVFTAQDHSRSEGALMAIENSIAGSILFNYSLIRESGLSITGEVFLRIKQNLMSLNATPIAQLQEVHSHPMAIAQCRNFFNEHPHIRLVETEDTALSAKFISEGKLQNVGAIASSMAAELYGLDIIAPGIETNKQNYTRFLVLQNGSTSPWTSSGKKVSLCFACLHQVGSLHKILASLAANGANLTKIQSAPIVGQSWHYLFFVDFVLADENQFEKTIEDIKPLTEDLKILGRYKNGEHYDH